MTTQELETFTDSADRWLPAARVLAGLLLEDGVEEAASLLTRLRTRPHTSISALVDIIERTERELGVLLEKGERNEIEITFALSGLLRISRRQRFECSLDDRMEARSILVSTLPAGLDLLGGAIHHHMLQLRHPSPELLFPVSRQMLLTKLGTDSFSILVLFVGTALGSDGWLPRTARTISAVRREKRFRDLPIVLSGHLPTEDQYAAHAIGADGVARSALDIVSVPAARAVA